MATEKRKKGQDPVVAAHDEAEKDMSADAELSNGDPTDDLDEGELARRDNSDEKALDALERPRRREGSADRSGSADTGKKAGHRADRGKKPGHHSGKGNEK